MCVFFSTRGVDGDDNVILKPPIGDLYMDFSDEGIIVNALGATLVALAILIPWIIGCPTFRKGLPREGRAENNI